MITIKRFISTYALTTAWIVTVVATLGSLYFSEIRGFVPCDLCWYQRILMYPLSVILLIASLRNDHRIVGYVIPLASIGWCISLFHYLKQKVPYLQAMETCKRGIPCSAEYINWLGFITIPFLAFVAFTLVILILSILILSENRSK